MLEVKNVSYAYKTKKDKTILNNVSATFEEGIFYTIVGPSGAGKTTLLTEMHLDDWTIAKLLGHTSVKNVKFYRKMSLQIIADETREIRAEMSRMIRANLAGWGKEYEQI